MASTTNTKPHTGYLPCAGCHKPVLLATDDAGQPRVLDTELLTWVVIGQAKDGTPQVRRSAGYVAHQCDRQA